MMIRKRLHLSGRFCRWHGALILSCLLALLLAIPILAEYLGPNRHTVELVQVRDPDNDVWTLQNIHPPTACPTIFTCLLIHTCDEHPSVEQATYWCCDGTLTRKWVATSSSCDKAYRWEEKEVDLPEATIDGVIANCRLVNGWCTTSPSLQLHGAEPLEGEAITGIEGARNGESFFCPGDACDVPLVEGQNNFSYWALSSYGDSSRMGDQAARVDTQPPQLTFFSPAQGSEIWATGKLEFSGSGEDATSGLAKVEISFDGGGNWLSLNISPDGAWSHTWDTSQAVAGSNRVLARGTDSAGNSATNSWATVLIDDTPPKVDLPQSWYIWEEAPLKASDAGSGLAKVEVTIDGGHYGKRKYTYRNPQDWLPKTIAWDRRFGDILAPIGEYTVTVEAWDKVGNRGVDSGVILIPDPEQSTKATPTEIIPATGPEGTVTTVADVEATANALTAAQTSLAGSAAATQTPMVVALAIDEGHEDGDSVSDAAPANIAPEKPEGANRIYWGVSAAALAAAAIAYGLDRRKKREAALAEQRRRARQASSPEARASRLRRLWNQAQRRVAPIRAAILAAVATAAAAAEAARREKQRRREQEESILNRLHNRLEPDVAAEIEHQPLANTEVVDTEFTPPHYDREFSSADQVEEYFDALANARSQGSQSAFASEESISDAAGILATVGKLYRKAKGIWNATGIAFNELVDGKISVSAPKKPPGEKLQFRQDQYIAGTRYNRTTLAFATAKSLFWKAARGLGTTLGISIVVNAIDYTIGEHSDKGIISNEFLASTMVDFGFAGLTGIAAAGLVSGAISIAAIAGAAFTGPLWIPVAITALLGLGLGIAVDYFFDTDKLKQKVADGFSAWGGIYENTKTIISVGADRAIEAARNFADDVVDASKNAAETVSETVGYLADNVADSASKVVETAVGALQQAGQSVSNAIDNASSAVSNFFGGLFRGGN